MWPGVYTGGIKLNVNNSGTVITMQPGIYYLNGTNNNGFNLNLSNGTTLTGSGVLIYNYPAGQNDNVNISNGGGTMNLSPMTTGTWAGITMWQSSSDSPGKMARTAKLFVYGTIYVDGCHHRVTGNGSTSLPHL